MLMNRVPLRRRLALLFPILLLLMACTSNPEVTSRVERLVEVGREIGNVVVQTKGTEFVRRKAPVLLPVLDKDRNGVLSLEELAALEQIDPAQWGALLVLLEAE